MQDHVKVAIFKLDILSHVISMKHQSINQSINQSIYFNLHHSIPVLYIYIYIHYNILNTMRHKLRLYQR